jgi:hypothetical protein
MTSTIAPTLSAHPTTPYPTTPYDSLCAPRLDWKPHIEPFPGIPFLHDEDAAQGHWHGVLAALSILRSVLERARAPRGIHCPWEDL